MHSETSTASWTRWSRPAPSSASSWRHTSTTTTYPEAPSSHGSTGAELLVPAAAAPAYRHRPAFHLEDIDLGAFVVRPLHTPGHTPEHTSYLILVEDEPVAVFSGGSLLVASAGRSDLLGAERAEALARLQYQSVHRLADLPDPVGLYPTHGEGSFCTTSEGSGHTSTIGVEKRSNPVLAYPDEDSFIDGELAGLGPWPSYYAHMGPANIRGASPMPDYEVPVLLAGAIKDLPSNVAVVDARPRDQYAQGHLPGSLAIELGDRFGTWVGWIVPYQAPLALVLDPGPGPRRSPHPVAADRVRRRSRCDPRLGRSRTGAGHSSHGRRQ